MEAIKRTEKITPMRLADMDDFQRAVIGVSPAGNVEMSREGN